MFSNTAGSFAFILRPGLVWEIPLFCEMLNSGLTFDIGSHIGPTINLPDDGAVFSAEAGLNFYFPGFSDYQFILSFREQFMTRPGFDDEGDLFSSLEFGVGF
jgi:hypothetical protein